MGNKFFITKNLFSKEYIQNIQNIAFSNHNEIIKNKNNGIDSNIIDINNFYGLKLYETENYSIPSYILGTLNNGTE